MHDTFELCQRGFSPHAPHSARPRWDIHTFGVASGRSATAEGCSGFTFAQALNLEPQHSTLDPEPQSLNPEPHWWRRPNDQPLPTIPSRRPSEVPSLEGGGCKNGQNFRWRKHSRFWDPLGFHLAVWRDVVLMNNAIKFCVKKWCVHSLSMLKVEHTNQIVMLRSGSVDDELWFVTVAVWTFAFRVEQTEC